MLRKSRQKRQLFGAAENQWRTLENVGRIEVLPDDETAELSAAVQRLCRMMMSQRIQQGRDLGELMVVAHAALPPIADSDLLTSPVWDRLPSR